MLQEAFETPQIDDNIINYAATSIYDLERKERVQKEPKLIDQLYRLQVFDWGGLHQNSLEATIVNNYVKKIRDYEELSKNIETELHHSMRGYVLCSWYNHWTSIMIEDIFRDHPNVLPAVSLINKIDFFVNDVPFDLKVTYLPEGFIKESRQSSQQRPELTLLKQWARAHKVPFETDDSESQLLPDLWTKASDHPSADGQQLMIQLTTFRQQLIKDVQHDSSKLIRWLYENQGTRRFDASNRLFVVLIDPSNFFESWKLKRARALLAENIVRFLDAVPSKPGRDITFSWEGSTYSAIADAIVIRKPMTTTFGDD